MSFKKYDRPFLCFILFFIGFGCSGDEERAQGEDEGTESKQERIDPPAFHADSAYHYIEKQVSFGPRVPNEPSHRKCAEYLESKLSAFGWETHVQKGEVEAYNGKELKIRNIYARLAPSKPERVMLYAHWDTRPMADRGEKRTDEPIPGANDGGSGVGVLLELARVMAERPPDIGVDIFFFDAEDQGQPKHTKASDQKSDTWCLGTQYWARNLPIENYAPKYGILLDMVGASDAVFPKEGVSMRYASWLVDRVWKRAGRIGYGNRFIERRVGPITDDHLYVNRMARIPSINIVHIEPESDDFGSFHHTHQDDMGIISKEPLRAVGETLLEVLYRE